MIPLGYEVPENPVFMWVFGHLAFLKIFFAIGWKKKALLNTLHRVDCALSLSLLKP